jgi:hypothetical protein
MCDCLSITGGRQLTNCGCSSFHLAIGSEGFILINLETPMPSHDITKELSQLSRILSLFQLLPGLCSLQNFRYFSSFLWPWMRFIRCSLGIKLASFYSSSTGELLLGVLYVLKKTLNYPQLNCQHGVGKLRVVAKYMPKVKRLVGV